MQTTTLTDFNAYCGATGHEMTGDGVTIDAGEALCLICRAGGCPFGAEKQSRYGAMLEQLRQDPMTPVQLRSDLDKACIVTKDALRADASTPIEYDYQARKRDMEILRRIGMSSGGVRPAYFVFNELFKEFADLKQICGGNGSAAWPGCSHAEGGYYESVAQGDDVYDRGVYRILDLPRREQLVEIKRETAATVAQADQLFIRPAHLMCLTCVWGRDDADKPLWQDNLVELRRRMQEEPDIPVTLVLGTNCDVCDPCPVYDAQRNLCLGHQKAQLRDYMVLERLDLPPHATLPARELFARLFAEIRTAVEICGWGDKRETSCDWRNCADVDSGNYERGVAKGLFE